MANKFWMIIGISLILTGSFATASSPDQKARNTNPPTQQKNPRVEAPNDMLLTDLAPGATLSMTNLKSLSDKPFGDDKMSCTFRNLGPVLYFSDNKKVYNFDLIKVGMKNYGGWADQFVLHLKTDKIDTKIELLCTKGMTASDFKTAMSKVMIRASVYIAPGQEAVKKAEAVKKGLAVLGSKPNKGVKEAGNVSKEVTDQPTEQTTKESTKADTAI